jgi:hypothetical protein
MSHFAKLDKDNVVVCVTAGRQEDDGKEEELSVRTGDVYKQTSYNTVGGVHLLGGVPFRKNFAGIGYTYDEQRDAFIPPNPFPSWTLNEQTCLWNPPIPKPLNGKFYVWNEETLSWIEV